MRCGERKPPQGVTDIQAGFCVLLKAIQKRIACLRLPYTTNEGLCQLIFTKKVHFNGNFFRDYFYLIYCQRAGGSSKAEFWGRSEISNRRKTVYILVLGVADEKKSRFEHEKTPEGRKTEVLSKGF